MPRLLLSFAFLALFAALAGAEEKTATSNYNMPDADGWRHGVSLMGQVNYPRDFAHFNYVNPQAPKGGRLRLSAQGAFDTFNITLPKGMPAPDLSLLVYQTLMEPATDEISTEYGQLAGA